MKRILLVDDSETALRLSQAILEQAPYQLIMASDGVEAVERAIEEDPDLILLDVVMPRLDGFGACRLLRGHPRTAEIPIILVTTLGDSDSMEKGFQNGATDYVTKPIDAVELLTKVQSHLGGGPGEAEAARNAGEAVVRIAELQKINGDLRASLTEYKSKAERLSDRYIEAATETAKLASLYVSVSQLHSCQTRQEVFEVVEEIVRNLIGSESAAIYYARPADRKAELVHTISNGEAFFSVVVYGEGAIGKAIESGIKVIASDGDSGDPVAAVPLMLGLHVVGALAIFDLLPQKHEFEELDHELLNLLTTHAAIALRNVGEWTDQYTWPQ